MKLRARKRLQIVMPVPSPSIYILLFLTYRSFLEAAHVLLAVPSRSLEGLPSVAAWVQLLRRCMGRLHRTLRHRRADDSRYGDLLEEAVARKKKRARHAYDLDSARSGDGRSAAPSASQADDGFDGSSQVSCRSSGVTASGPEVIRPLATPVLGGMLSSLAHVLIVTPIIFLWLRERELRRGQQFAIQTVSTETIS